MTMFTKLQTGFLVHW